ncbi:HTH_Tnp_Tc3_2 domain-containing protein [Trichonephila clavipes]|nr:HTH_Tnp_Tc3_2 domain-containing protein [Trichonephila clavipes]
MSIHQCLNEGMIRRIVVRLEASLKSSPDLYRVQGNSQNRIKLMETVPGYCILREKTRARFSKSHYGQRRLPFVDYNQWVTVLFTDKSRFSRNTDSCRTFLWREPETPTLTTSNIREIVNYGRGALMIRASFMLDGSTSLNVFEGGTVTDVSEV